LGALGSGCVKVGKEETLREGKPRETHALRHTSGLGEGGGRVGVVWSGEDVKERESELCLKEYIEG